MMQPRTFVLSVILAGVLLGSGCIGRMGNDMSAPSGSTTQVAKEGSESGSVPTATASKTAGARGNSSSSEQAEPALSPQDRKIRAHRERIAEIMRENREMRMPSSLNDAHAKVAVRQKYTLGTVASAVVGSGQALSLECAANPFNVHELVIYPNGKNGHVYAYVVFQYNSFDVRRVDKATSSGLDFSPRQNPAVVVYVKWRSKAKGLEFRVEAKGNQGFGKAVSAEMEIVREKLLTTVQPGPANESPQERSVRLRQMILKRRAYDKEMKKRVDALKSEYKMGSDL